MISFLVAINLISSLVFAADSAEHMLQKADAIRNPSENYQMMITVKTPESTQELQVYLKGTDKTLIVTKAPAKDRGRNMLMLDRDFYAYVPNLKRSMRLSLAQKLSGQVANGDIARTRWYGDYAAVIEKETPEDVQLLLDGNKPGLTYQKIRLWLEKKTFRPLHAEYLSVNGKTILKRSYFEDYKKMAGADRPTVIRIEDIEQHTSRLEISKMEKETQPDSFFTERNMETLH